MIPIPRPSFSRLAVRLATCALIGLVAAVPAGMPAKADEDAHESAHDEVRDGVASGRIKSLAELRRTVLSRVPGDIVSARVEQEHGLDLYEFRVLRADGRLVEVEVDAGSGEIREIEND
ncbi:PepSY domain-containing protein [Rhizobium sp. AG855]|uniref:PepSY domain-containing protein n=1 Tax=Rhizobium sp. AG855 TaxID=2183898 RepID=UPI000E74629C|nr:PepSY domain-containing protein [Rhizobium sp. AG855]RKE83992.1 peptidase YpeB-like protein [Rhizobium sp. AG855]